MRQRKAFDRLPYTPNTKKYLDNKFMHNFILQGVVPRKQDVDTVMKSPNCPNTVKLGPWEKVKKYVYNREVTEARKLLQFK